MLQRETEKAATEAEKSVADQVNKLVEEAEKADKAEEAEKALSEKGQEDDTEESWDPDGAGPGPGPASSKGKTKGRGQRPSRS